VNHPTSPTQHRRPAPPLAPPCTSDPDRWAGGGDDPDLRQLCRGCPRRWRCASEALNVPHAEGMWSGVYLPEEGRGRATALRQLQSLAAHAGYTTQPAFTPSRRRAPQAPTLPN
jgi:WhiB family redox-sensing transcriptional regulator